MKCQKMKRTIFLFLLLNSCLLSFGQTDFLKDAVAKLEVALVKKDTGTIKKLLHPNVTYGHSNGWVQNKSEVTADLAKGKLSYLKIVSRNLKWQAAKDWASVRSTSSISYRLDGKESEMELHVLQVWVKTNKGWQLFARQATKI